MREFPLRFPLFTPGFKEPGFWTWAYKAAPNLVFFIALQVVDNYDKFAVEIAWSEDGQYPWHGTGQIEAERPQGRARIEHLVLGGGDLCDLAPEATAAIRAASEARLRGDRVNYGFDPPIEVVLPRVEPMVRDAIQKLEEYGVPLFRRVAEARSLDWPSGIKK
jgi:hypothetical protein